MILEDQVVRSETQEIYLYIKDKNERKMFQRCLVHKQKTYDYHISNRKKTRIQVRKQSKKYLHELKKIILDIKGSNQVSSNTKHSETHLDTIYFKN